MDKIKLCHITESTSGGVWTHVKQLAEHLDPTRFEQEFIVSTLKNPILANTNNLYGHRLHFVDMERNIKPWPDILATLRILQILQSNRFDIIHCHSSKAGAVGRLAAKLAGIRKVIYTPHAFSFFNKKSTKSNLFFITAEKILSKWSQEIVCVSEGEMNLAVQAGLPLHKMACIPNGVNLQSVKSTADRRIRFFNDHGLSTDTILLGFIGRMAIQKNPLLLLKAVEVLPEKVKVCFVGGGPMLETVRKETVMRGLQNRVLFLGDRDDVNLLIPIFDLYISTSEWEGLPYSVLEAISARTPVIISDIYGHRELISHEREGLTFEPGDAEDLVRQILFALENREMMKVMADLAWVKVNEKYNLARMIRSYEGLYQRMMR